MFLTCLAFAFWALILASNIFKKPLAWIITTVIAFIAMLLITKFALETLFGIAIAIYAIITIFVLIKQKKK